MTYTTLSLSPAEREVMEAAREHAASVLEGQHLALDQQELGQRVSANHTRTSAAADRLKDALSRMRMEAAAEAVR